jgi:cytochrome c
MMRVLPLILMLAASAASSACAQPPAAARPAAQDPVAAAASRGHAVAERLCARCHAIEASGDSPDARAPAFRTLTGQFVPLTLERKLTEIAETGHYDMPPVSVHADEVADLAAYINSFGERWRGDDRRDLPR